MTDVRGQLTQELVFEGERLTLLLFAVHGDTLIVTSTELVGWKVIENLAVSRGEGTIPGTGATARDNEEPIGIDVELLGKPSQEWHPIQQLESHLTEPWTGHDRCGAGGQFREPLLHTRRLHSRDPSAHGVSNPSRHELS
jgi:hypothetical protein